MRKHKYSNLIFSPFFAHHRSLPNRYNRLRSAFDTLKAGETDILMAAKQEVEAKFESEKWNAIAESMVKMGADRYPVEFVKKEWIKMGGGLKTSSASSASPNGKRRRLSD